MLHGGPPTLKNPYSLVLVFMFRPLSFPGSLTCSPPLFFYKLNPMFLTIIVFRSLVFYRNPLSSSTFTI
jgi:hypothetical protein